MMEATPFARTTDRSLNFRRHRGFSLIEVMMSVVLLAIGTAIAVPSFRDQVEKRQITSGAEQLASFVNTAQGAAMRSNNVVTISWSFTDSNDWCIGAVEGDTACNCTVRSRLSDGYCEIDDDRYILDEYLAKDRGLVHQISGDGSYAFDPVRGLFVDLDDAFTMTLRSRSGEFRLNLNINNTGRVTLCSADEIHAIPGYDVCPQTVDGEVEEAGL